ncbi:hypothetical protein ACFX13_003011 [Malus domestica]
MEESTRGTEKESKEGVREKEVRRTGEKGGLGAGEGSCPLGSSQRRRKKRRSERRVAALAAGGEETWRYGGSTKKVRSVEQHGKDAALGSWLTRVQRNKKKEGEIWTGEQVRSGAGD